MSVGLHTYGLGALFESDEPKSARELARAARKKAHKSAVQSPATQARIARREANDKLWAGLLDGRPHRLVPGVDFQGSANWLRQLLAFRALYASKRVSVNKDGDAFLVRVRSDEGPR